MFANSSLNFKHFLNHEDNFSQPRSEQCWKQNTNYIFFSRPPDIVVNSAGITMDKYLLRMSEESFDKVIDVNLKGTFLINQITATAMKKAEIKGSIVNISSLVGKTGNVGQANYSASKAGVIAFTKTAAKELGKFGIRVNCICPGFIQTAMTDAVPEHVSIQNAFSNFSCMFLNPNIFFPI